ncbi:alpha/beta-hydrolase [Macrolepiota fuliginosa MF-IS2]|uniref:Alpha/beta-hydrolase n=1 Tax=Macrolepiota fuliginosa MF-IS2 TaxID=1400762 RepID=A0A9P6C334_9AGAR|nr:alpha/beta-hydrolase [Macrolepiota fuliginosa MF-IS2]
MKSFLVLASFLLNFFTVDLTQAQDDALGFYHLVSDTTELCTGVKGPAPSFGGWIGLQGDSNAAPKRSFFWYFEAEEKPNEAPLVLSMGGGPGSSGMMNALDYEAPCLLGPNGTLTVNENRWTEKFNLLALDHPVGVGYSYGTRVNNSQDAAEDVYDFLQKFFKLYPNLAKNQLVVADGSYGGVYLAHIGSVINNHNKQLEPDKVHLNLESMIIHNPIFNVLAHYQWLLHYRCFLHQVHNTTTCQELTGYVGPCVEAIQLAFELPSVENSNTAQNICLGQLSAGGLNGILLEDIRKRCDSDDTFVCYPVYLWANDLFNGPEFKRVLRVPDGVDFAGLGNPVETEFFAAGDIVQPHHLLYEPLLQDGIRLLFTVGAQDANCAWPGVLSSIKLLQWSSQTQFINARDEPWPSRNMTVRKVGKGGAGQLTYILLQDAGHTPGEDQPGLVKGIAEKWIPNVEFF